MSESDPSRDEAEATGAEPPAAPALVDTASPPLPVAHDAPPPAPPALHVAPPDAVELAPNAAAPEPDAADPAPVSVRPPASVRAPALVSAEPAPESARPPASVRAPVPPREPPPPLRIDSVLPTNSPLAGGVRVTVVGKGFVPGLRVWLGPNEVAATELDGDSLSFDAPPGPAGPVTVRLEAPSEDGAPQADARSVELAYAFRYDPAPLAVRLDPDWSSVAGRPRATIFGAHFDAACRVEVGGAPVEVERFDGARVELTVAAHDAGEATVVVVNPDGQRSRSLLMTFLDPPVIESVVPAEASVDGGVEVAVRGRHFTPACVVTIDGAPATVVTRGDDEIKVAVPPRITGGRVDVRVVESHGLAHVLHGTFTYLAKPAPIVEAVFPPRGPNVGGTTLAVRGRFFLPGCRVRVFETDVATTFHTPDHLEVVTPAVPGGGPVDVRVTNPDGQSHTAARAFVYDAALAPPRLVTVSPPRASQVGGAKVTLLGDDFAEGCQARFGGVVVDVKFLTRKEVHTVAPASAAGTVDVDLVNPDGQTARLEGAFTFDAVPPPVIASVSPPNGPTTGGTRVVIEGENFTDTCAVLIGRERPQAIPKRSKTEIIAVTPPHKSAGVVDVEVIVPGVGNSIKKNAFRYDALPAPLITQVTPSRVGTEGGSDVTINGKNFLKDTVVLIDGRPARVKFLDAGTLDVKTPPGPNGKMADVVVRNADGKEAVQKKAVQFDSRYG